MRLVHLYLVGYFALVLGALLSLWSGDVLRRLPTLWVVLAVIVAVGFGVALAATSTAPQAAAEPD